MTVESNDAIAIASLSDCIKSLSPVFQSLIKKQKQKQNQSCLVRTIFPAPSGCWEFWLVQRVVYS